MSIEMVIGLCRVTLLHGAPSSPAGGSTALTRSSCMYSTHHQTGPCLWTQSFPDVCRSLAPRLAPHNPSSLA
jgi:hypothetical protein